MSIEFELLSRLVKAVGDGEDTEAILKIAKQASAAIKNGDRIEELLLKNAELSRMICEAHVVLESAQDRAANDDPGSAMLLVDVAVRTLAEHAEK